MEKESTEPFIEIPLLKTSPSSSSFSSLINRLYLGYFLCRWDSRMWEFSVGLYMINIWPGSLLLAAVYGVFESSSIVLFGPLIGHWVHRLTYIKLLRLWLVAQNLSFIFAGGSVVALLVYPSLKYSNPVVFVALIVLTNVSGAISMMSALAGSILIEREWVVVISESDDDAPELKAKMNSAIRRMDLTCKLFAPVVAGFIIGFISIKASALTLALWNTVSVWLQYWLFSSVYGGIPALQERNLRKTVSPDLIMDPEESTCDYQHLSSTLSESKMETEKSTSCLSMRELIIKQIVEFHFVSAWRMYLSQEVVLPGVALALLHYSVLSFGTLMTATLQSGGIPLYVIGLAGGLSGLVGIAATFLYPIVHLRIQTLRTGLWSVWFQWSFLLVCVASIMVQNPTQAAYMLIGGAAMSRLGLCMFNLAVIQQMQDHVPESDRCIVGGVQDSIQYFMYMLTFVTGMIISDPKEFGKLTLISFICVTLSAVLYTFHIYRVRKNYIQLEKYYAVSQWLIPRR